MIVSYIWLMCVCSGPAQVQMVNLAYQHSQQEIHVVHEFQEVEQPPPPHIPCCEKCCCEVCCHKCNCCCNGCECCNMKCCLIAIAIIGIILIPILIGVVAYFCYHRQNAGDGPGPRFGMAVEAFVGTAQSSATVPQQDREISPGMGAVGASRAVAPQVTSRNASVATGCYCCWHFCARTAFCGIWYYALHLFVVHIF